MAKTITTHNGSRVFRDHNIRHPSIVKNQSHIDVERIKFNEILIDEQPRDAYNRIFGQALLDYNVKLSDKNRCDRLILDYYEHICKDKVKHPVYEMIIQIGGRNDTGSDAPLERDVLKKFISGWKDRNPHLELIGAYMHADEATLHAHLDYIPVATGYTKGMRIQNGLDKALKQQGFVTKGRKDTAQMQWERRENLALDALCQESGLEIEHPCTDRQHFHTTEYKEYIQEIEALEAQISSLKCERNNKLDELPEQTRKSLQEQIEKATLYTENRRLNRTVEKLKRYIHDLGKEPSVIFRTTVQEKGQNRDSSII